MKIEIWESKEKQKVVVKVDSNNIGWVTKTDFDYIFKKYKQIVKICVILLLECVAFIILWFLK